MEDRIETIAGDSIIQHGKLNDRIYLIKLGNEDCPGILDVLRDISRENSYAKIFGKIPAWAAPFFFADGYSIEAIIPGFYKGIEDAFFVSKYLDSDRIMNLEKDRLGDLGRLLKNPVSKGKFQEDDLKKVKLLNSPDVEQITGIYRKVFLSYPFPIHNPGYILKTMKGNIRYFGVKEKKRLVAVASAEIDFKGKNAEMTDFATDPDFRGRKLGQLLLVKMEKAMKTLELKTLYTIARVQSVAMNKVFLKHRYHYGGTLIKNTNISGSIESMNVYYKHI